MSLLDAIKRAVRVHSGTKKLIQDRKIKFSEINKWINHKENEQLKKEQDFREQIENKIIQIINDIENGIINLKKIDLYNKQTDQRIRLIVKANLENYITHLKKLINNLDNLNLSNEKQLISKINLYFDIFERSSAVSFQKASILIGSELDKITQSISAFLRYLDSLAKRNSELILSFNLLSDIKSSMIEFNEIQQAKIKFKKKISELNKEIKLLENDLISKNIKIEEIQKRKDYVKRLEEIRHLEQNKNDLKKEIFVLKNLIDFKRLASIFHSYSNKMDIIKKYKDNFEEKFYNDNSKCFIELICDAGMNQKKVLKSMEKIKQLQLKINHISIPKDPTEELKNKIIKIKSQIEILNSRKNHEESKRSKLNIKCDRITNFLRNKLSRLDIKLDVNS